MKSMRNSKSAMSYCDKVQNASESKLLPGISVDLQEVEKQDSLYVNGVRKFAVLDLDVEDSDEISSTSSDEFAACVVEDSEEICETQDDNECQSSANHQNEVASSEEVANSIATTSLPSEYMLNVGLAQCVVSASEAKKVTNHVSRPITRSRTTAPLSTQPLSMQSESAKNSSLVISENLPPPPHLPKDSSQGLPLQVELAKRCNNQGIGSMEAYMLMKDRQKTLEKEKKKVDDGETSHSETHEEIVETSTGKLCKCSHDNHG